MSSSPPPPSLHQHSHHRLSISSLSGRSRSKSPTPLLIESNGVERRFDMKRVRDAFASCVQPDGSLLLAEYVRGWDELCFFLSSLGMVFDFATKDLRNKLIVLTEHMRLDPLHYSTIQSMVLYEVQVDRVKERFTETYMEPGKPLPNGSRTLLRLHRALAFLSRFLAEMTQSPEDEGSAAIAWNAYSTTLGTFHSWPVRHTIHAAIKLTVPNREDLITKMLNQRTPDDLNIMAKDMMASCSVIETTTQALFEKYHLTKLV